MEHERESTVDAEIEFIKETGLIDESALGIPPNLLNKSQEEELKRKEESKIKEAEIDRSIAEEMNVPPIPPVQEELPKQSLEIEKTKEEVVQEPPQIKEEEISLEELVKVEKPKEEHPKKEQSKEVTLHEESTLSKTKQEKEDEKLIEGKTKRIEELERVDDLARTMSEKAILEEKGVWFKEKLLKEKEKESDNNVVDRNKPNIYYVMDMMKQVRRPMEKRAEILESEKPFEKGEEIDEKAGLLSKRAILEAKGVLFKMAMLNDDEKETNDQVIEKNNPNISYALKLVRGMKHLSLAEQIKLKAMREAKNKAENKYETDSSKQSEQKHVKFKEIPDIVEKVREKMMKESEKEVDISEIEENIPRIEERMRKMREWEMQYFSEPRKDVESESKYNPTGFGDPITSEEEEEENKEESNKYTSKSQHEGLVVQNMPNLSIMLSKLNEIETIEDLESKLEHHKNFTLEFVKEMNEYLDKNKEFFLPKTPYVDEDKLIVLLNLDKQIQTLCKQTFSSLHESLLEFYKNAKKNWNEAMSELNKINKEKEKTR